MAIWLPSGEIRANCLKEVDDLEAEVTSNCEIGLVPGRNFDRNQFLARIHILRAQMPMTAPVVATMRQEDCY